MPACCAIALDGQRSTTPLGFVHAMVEHGFHEFRHELDAIRRHVGCLENIIGAARRDVGIHLLHPGELEFRRELILRGHRALEQLARDARLLQVHVGNRAELARGLDQLEDKRVRNVEGIDQHALAFLQFAGESGQHLGQPGKTGIIHADTFAKDARRSTEKLRPLPGRWPGSLTTAALVVVDFPY
ncbi:MAG: hypothetical protein WDM96_04485 [Lacunisphaera sp.]